MNLPVLYSAPFLYDRILYDLSYRLPSAPTPPPAPAPHSASAPLSAPALLSSGSHKFSAFHLFSPLLILCLTPVSNKQAV